MQHSINELRMNLMLSEQGIYNLKEQLDNKDAVIKQMEEQLQFEQDKIDEERSQKEKVNQQMLQYKTKYLQMRQIKSTLERMMTHY